MAKRRRKKYEFKPDVQRIPLSRRLHLTQHQQRQLLKWGLYGLVCLVMLIIQDVLMSRIHIWAATTDLVVGVILLIAVMEDTEDGALFALIGSMFYVFSGSAPGPYVVAYLTVLATAAVIFRQMYWRRGYSSNVLCAGIALLLYELALYITGVFMGLTYWSRVGVFVLTALYTWLVMILIYPLLHKIQRIGGETWKE